MKNLIKRILKESVDNGIVDVLIKLDLPNYPKIYDFLLEIGYDENEVKEIYSIYFEYITGSDLTPRNWMDFYFSPDQLQLIDLNVYTWLDRDSIYYSKNDLIVMEYFESGKSFWFDFSQIWLPIKNTFELDSKDIEVQLKLWLKSNFDFDVKKVNFNTHGW
jgi:hypothetical protein